MYFHIFVVHCFVGPTWSWLGWIMWSIHYSYVIMSAMASQITGGSIVCSTVCSGVDQRKHQSSSSLAFVRGILTAVLSLTWKSPYVDKTVFILRRGPDDVVMYSSGSHYCHRNNSIIMAVKLPQRLWSKSTGIWRQRNTIKCASFQYFTECTGIPIWDQGAVSIK